ncbi:unnamed protein product [Soboliphyme baturini]|uniref:Serine/threonine-protein kinase n=1 Tax=Soboliphyme baturini TaxID=241478 RepID=A0A183J9E0_9BILA|nr:unnamed protein product [Soboliphyme baturini]
MNNRCNNFEEVCAGSQRACRSDICDESTSSAALSDADLSHRAASDTSSFDEDSVKKYYRKQRYNKGWATRKQLRKQLRNSTARSSDDRDRHILAADKTTFSNIEDSTNDGDSDNFVTPSNSERVSLNHHNGPSVSYYNSCEKTRLIGSSDVREPQVRHDVVSSLRPKLFVTQEATIACSDASPSVDSSVTKMHIGSPLQQHSRMHPETDVTISDQSFSTFSDFASPTSPTNVFEMQRSEEDNSGFSFTKRVGPAGRRCQVHATTSDVDVTSLSTSCTSSQKGQKLVLKIAVDAPNGASNEQPTSVMSSSARESLVMCDLGDTLKKRVPDGSLSTEVNLDSSGLCLSTKNVVSVQVSSSNTDDAKVRADVVPAGRLDPEVENLLCSMEDIPLEREETKRYNSFSEASAIFDYLYGYGRTRNLEGKVGAVVDSVYENLTSTENSPEKEPLYDFPIQSPSALHSSEQMLVDNSPSVLNDAVDKTSLLETSPSSPHPLSNGRDNVLKKYSDYFCTRICLSFGKQESLEPNTKFRDVSELAENARLNRALRNSSPPDIIRSAQNSIAAEDINMMDIAMRSPPNLDLYSKRFLPPPPTPTLDLSGLRNISRGCSTSSEVKPNTTTTCPIQLSRNTGHEPAVTLPRSKGAPSFNTSSFPVSYFNRLSSCDENCQKNLHYYYV